MNTPQKYHHRQQETAGKAIIELRDLAERGNAEAVEALRNIALHAISVLETINLHNVQHHSHRWPVALDAMQEKREAELERFAKLEVGSKLGVRLTGKARGFSYDEQTGFVYDCVKQIQAVRANCDRYLSYAERHPEMAKDWRDKASILPELTKENMPEWEAVVLEFLRYTFMDDLSLIGSKCVLNKVGKKTGGIGEKDSPRALESAIKGRISLGLEKLIPR